MTAPRRAAALLGSLSLLTGGLAVAASPASAVPGAVSPVFLNEIHYDNTGTDAGEFVEVANPAGADLTGWSVVLYNGSNGATYDTDALSGSSIIQTVTYSGTLQNGSPDAVALVDGGGGLVQFLSYEGPLTATNGPASGQTSTDIGVSEAGTELIGQSLQLTGEGATYGDFTWTGPVDDTPGEVNTGQTFTDGGSGPSPLAATDPDDVTTAVDEPIDPITLRASGGTSPYAWDVSGLPAGLSETSDGVIEGTPTQTGVSTVTATVSDSATPAATDTVSFTITVERAQVVSIAAIQGTGAATPLAGQKVTTRGVVTAAYPTGGFFGFVIQTPGTGGSTDATPGASDALWVYQTAGGVDAQIGQHVEVTGVVGERFGRTELTYDPSAGALEVLTGDVPPVTPLVTGYWATAAEREGHESELLDLSGQDFTVTDNYSTNQYGEVGLATGDRPLVTPTEVANPNLDPAGYQAALAENAARGVILDDGSSWDYVRSSTAKSEPLPWIDQETTARVGATATLTGPVVLDYGFSAWRLQPTSQVNGPQPGLVSFEDTRPDNAAPQAVGGDLRIATFNVLNYFNTTGKDFVESGRGTCSYYTDRTGDEVTNNRCNPNGPRGAAEDEDLARQQVKIVEAINTLDASVVSLEEIENSLALGEADRDDALAELTDALNQAAGGERWAYVPSPPADALPASEDVIRTAFIYDPSVVALEGESVIFDDPAFSNARQPLAQAFRPVGTTEARDAFAVIANHFKSKGSACEGQPEGPQGNCNESRIGQARALDGFADDFAQQRDLEQVFLAGDFNSYSQEDPMIVLENLGYTKLESSTEDEWSYSFDGMSGSLDHVLANDAALAEVTGVDIWEINANEALAFEYSRFNYNVTQFYEENVFRASDHNPELVGIDVRDASDVVLTLSPSTIKQKKQTSTATVTIGGVDDDATGVVRFLVDGQPIGQRALLDGTAEIRVGPFEKGSYEVTVDYLGDDDNLPGTDTATLRVGLG